MNSQASTLTLGLLPEPGTRWGRFVLGYGMQSLVMAFFVITAVIYPEVLVLPVHDYHFVTLVSTPPPVPQTPAPIKHFRVPEPKLTEPVTPRPEAMRVPSEIVQKKTPLPEEQAPKVTVTAKKELLPDVKATIPRPPVKTNVFSTGSSATPTMAAAPEKVQTGGFGDPNGVPASDTHGRPVTIARAGSFDLPAGPGYGNGTGGAHGARGVVASTGFGSWRCHRQQFWQDFWLARCGPPRRLRGRGRRCLGSTKGQISRAGCSNVAGGDHLQAPSGLH